jgi:hypothetical protein
MPFECAASSASAIWMPKSSTVLISSGFPSNPVPECLPLQQFHGDEGSPIGLVNLMDRADVRVVQRGSSFRFTLETTQGLWIVGQFVGKELQGDVTTQLQVFRLVDHTHPTAPDLAKYAVMRDRLAYRLGGTGHWQEC